MTKVTNKTIIHLAKLAKLKLTRDEINIFSKQLSEFLSHTKKMNEISIEDVKPTSNVTGLVNRTREDRVKDSISQSMAIANAPVSTKGGYFKVEKYHDNQRTSK